ncbi:nuclear distribution C-like protein [Encephalitozoon hellem ATCC 50504]|uniref:Nuclear movement protein n=1 Tax=Encephalitozoon hellem TaxID=27973 RepID=A0A9Q9C1L5_ENCHE|nr:nuclear distribution C-like protein [Encephalitozoon hellem ATCC 50504]AEI69236.1 nuclear distribution C-like protein [Encephalitozoon hellem ATCC 50504]UTX42434.1 protein SHQ1 [Encephalitozoon hellem]WEL37877.1 nuclear movement protein [Encephalitozoon hellem]|eukprot:XP_003886723.1 nuclear distribution C-like protein [Encephalitozoon hellem ATCC 50504]
MPQEAKYTWDQELNEINIRFPMVEGVDSSSVKISVVGRKVLMKIQEDVIMDGEFLHEVDSSSLWWVVDGDTVDINITKKRNEWWDSLLVGSETVDVQKLAEDKHADISMLDPEAREVVEKMMHNTGKKDSSELCD